MRKRLRMLAVIALLSLMPLQSAWGWNSIGHMAVAYVAYQHLTAKQKARAAALLKLNPDYKLWVSYLPKKTSAAKTKMYVFMMAATWPDEIKASNSGYTSDHDTIPDSPEATSNAGYTDMLMHTYWHYIDVPFSTDGTPLPPVPSVNAQTQIAALRQDIASDEADAVKSYDLTWLMHLVGDVHQPLHCTSRISSADPKGDAGGNLVKIDTSAKELHAFWDNLLGSGSTKNYATALTAAEALAAADPTAAADLKEADWVQESFTLAQSKVYVDPPIGPGNGPYTIASGPTYASDSLAVAKQQIALAGARLAKVLNAELK